VPTSYEDVCSVSGLSITINHQNPKQTNKQVTSETANLALPAIMGASDLRI